MSSLQPPTQLSLVETVEITTELYLKTFIRWALQCASSTDCSSEAALALLDQAWDAQKLLWQLRDANWRLDEPEARPAPAAQPQPLPAPDRSQPVCS
jgi:hypothetical protein